MQETLLTLTLRRDRHRRCWMKKVVVENRTSSVGLIDASLVRGLGLSKKSQRKVVEGSRGKTKRNETKRYETKPNQTKPNDVSGSEADLSSVESVWDLVDRLQLHRLSQVLQPTE